MKIQQFLEHHGISSNPFAEEDAQTDPVFKEHCIASTYHPTWDKIYGDPAEPATSIVFGEKGAGKTAMRLQIVRHLAFGAYLREHADVRDGYAALKREVYGRHPADIDAYGDGKDAWIKRVERVAEEWYLRRMGEGIVREVSRR